MVRALKLEQQHGTVRTGVADDGLKMVQIIVFPATLMAILDT